jgi:hypothetical protein
MAKDEDIHPITGQPQIEERQEGVPDNTPAQDEHNAKAEAQWAEEQKWPLFEVVISGDDAVWVPRKDERYWRPEDPNDPNSAWVPRAAEELPDDAYLSDDGQVVREMRGTVLVRAKSEEHARMLALRDNTEYHSVESVTKKKTD